MPGHPGLRSGMEGSISEQSKMEVEAPRRADWKREEEKPIRTRLRSSVRLPGCRKSGAEGAGPSRAKLRVEDARPSCT